MPAKPANSFPVFYSGSLLFCGDGLATACCGCPVPTFSFSVNEDWGPTTPEEVPGSVLLGTYYVPALCEYDLFFTGLMDDYLKIYHFGNNICPVSGLASALNPWVDVFVGRITHPSDYFQIYIHNVRSPGFSINGTFTGRALPAEVE